MKCRIYRTPRLREFVQVCSGSLDGTVGQVVAIVHCPVGGQMWLLLSIPSGSCWVVSSAVNL